MQATPDTICPVSVVPLTWHARDVPCPSSSSIAVPRFDARRNEGVVHWGGADRVARRLALVQAWRAPDGALVNLSEPGAPEVMKALIQAGVGIEAGVWTVEDAERLAASGWGG